MTNSILIYIGSFTIIAWGIAHIAPIKSVVSGFGNITNDNKLILTMEWIAEGITLIFIGSLVLLVTLLKKEDFYTINLVYLSSAAMLIVLAVLSLFTGARTSILPFKLCPVI